MIKNVTKTEVSKNVYSFKKDDMEMVKEGQWYETIQKMKKEGLFQDALTGMCFPISQMPKKSNYLGYYYFFQSMNRYSPFFEEAFDSCIFMLTEKGFEVTVCYAGENVEIFLEKGGVNNNAMEQLFVKDEISDDWLLIEKTIVPRQKVSCGSCCPR
ncbi:hypothetical protein [Solidesulfovibrio magneticus]|nr:hypothetical protein [Solidesulfovibrio magneticus]